MAKNYGFAIHTSSPELGLAMGKFGEPVRCQTWHLGRDLSTQLHQHISEFMPPQTWADLQLIAVARGPGSFTGTRLGVVTARTLAQQLDIPLFAISTLAAAAYNLAGGLCGEYCPRNAGTTGRIICGYLSGFCPGFGDQIA